MSERRLAGRPCRFSRSRYRNHFIKALLTLFRSELFHERQTFGVGDVGALPYAGLSVGSACSMEWLQELGNTRLQGG